MRGHVIPEDILQRIEEFATTRKTGQIVLNVYDGRVVSGEVRDHFKTKMQKIVDNETHGP